MLESVTSLDQTRPEVVRSVEASLARLSDHQTSADCEEPQCISSLQARLSSSLTSSLACRLPGTVCGHLCQLTLSLVRLQSEAASSVLEWRDRLAELTRGLPCLVTLLYNRPVFHSHLAEGILLQAPLSLPSTRLNLSTSNTSSITLVILSQSGKATGSKVTVQLCGDKSTHIRQFQ